FTPPTYIGSDIVMSSTVQPFAYLPLVPIDALRYLTKTSAPALSAASLTRSIFAFPKRRSSSAITISSPFIFTLIMTLTSPRCLLCCAPEHQAEHERYYKVPGIVRRQFQCSVCLSVCMCQSDRE